MIRYQLPTGKTIILKDEVFYLSDEQFQEKIQELIAADSGVLIEDPFVSLRIKEFKDFDIPELEENIDDIPIEEIEKIKNELNGNEGD